MKISILGYNIDINKIKKGVCYSIPMNKPPRFKIIKKKIKEDEAVEVENKLKEIWKE
jgi:hypothetical protein